MIGDRMIIPGIVKNGLIIPQSNLPLPEGTRVDIHIPPPEITPELQAEFDAWERASDEAWAQIEQWERKEKS
jgi:hypothetical protein